MSKVVAAGVFDGLHDGHRFYLRSAKKFGGHLTVIVARDASVPVIKKKHPKRDERTRLAAVARLPWVDRAVLGDRLARKHSGDRFLRLLALKPDIVCLGYDQPVKVRDLRRFLDARGMRHTRVLRIGRAPGRQPGRRGAARIV